MFLALSLYQLSQFHYKLVVNYRIKKSMDKRHFRARLSCNSTICKFSVVIYILILSSVLFEPFITIWNV